jgi:hypothetical protein
MPTVAEAFNQFHEHLKLDPADRAAAIKRHNDVRDVLREAGISTSAFLQGSFARKTAMDPLRDVDLVVLLRDDDRDELCGPGGADTAMDRCQSALAVAWADIAFDRTNHSLEVDFGEDDFLFDVVPAFQDTDDADIVHIAARDRAPTPWEWSNTKVLIRTVQERNDACGGRFIHVARMGKHFVRAHLNGIVSGLFVESLLYTSMHSQVAYEQACRQLFEAAAEALSTNTRVMDPTGVDDLAAMLSTAERFTAATVFGQAAQKAREASRLRQDGDETAAIGLWHDIFGGGAFPAPPSRSVADAAKALQGGSFTSGGGVSSSHRGQNPSRPVRSWRR